MPIIIRLGRIGLRRLDHLDTPGIADEASGDRNPERPLVLRKIKVLRAGRRG
jgi:hypothetical protein